MFPVALVVSCALGAGYVLPHRNATLPARFAAFVLQILGIASVAADLGSRQRHFHQQGWFVRLWGALQAPRNITVNVQAGVMTVAGVGTVTAVSSARAVSVEDRIAELERAHERLRAETRTQFDEVRTSVRNAEQRIGEERHRAREIHSKVRDDLQSLTAGGIHIEKVGLAWLVFGTLFSAFPDEIADWLSAGGRALIAALTS